MKRKSKAIFYAVLGMIGIVGASASTVTRMQEITYQFVGGGGFIPLDPSQKGQPGGWDCQPSSATCTYRKIDPEGPTIESNMTRACTGIFVNL